jgi:hypothetical protein
MTTQAAAGKNLTTFALDGRIGLGCGDVLLQVARACPNLCDVSVFHVDMVRAHPHPRCGGRVRRILGRSATIQQHINSR